MAGLKTAKRLALAAVPAVLALACVPAAAQSGLEDRIEAVLAASPGTRFGLVVADESGREIFAINPEMRFIPASNTKMFVTAAAFANMTGLAEPDVAAGTGVRLETGGRGPPDVVLVGAGDARLSSRDDCRVDCLAELADAVAAQTRTVRDVIGDDSRFPDQRWSPGMSWNNIPTRSGTGISALSLDDNEITLTIVPAAGTPRVGGMDYYRIDNRVRTVPAGGPTSIAHDRMPGDDLVRLTGTIAADAAPETLRLGIDDPAHYAAWRLRALLAARGVRVAGGIAVRHRPLSALDDPAARGQAPAMRPPEQEMLARTRPAPLIEDLQHTNTVSQNLHSELLLRRLGLRNGTGSIADGIAVIAAMLDQAGVAKDDWDFSDGSGMSTYNRVAPRGMVRLLGWISRQSWGAAWRGTLPVAGRSGTLADRFAGTPLEGRLFAKTGTLNATNALSGYLVARSGRVLTFSAFANDVPGGGGATAAIDAALNLVAEAH